MAGWQDQIFPTCALVDTGGPDVFQRALPCIVYASGNRVGAFSGWNLDDDGAEVMLGGMVSSSFADLSCDGIADCAHIAAQQGWPGSSLNPWREPHVEPVAQGPVNPDGALAQLAHRLWAPVVLLLALPTAWLAWRRGARGSALALIALLALQVAAGVWLLTPVLPLPAALLHNLLAALLVTLLARLL